VSDESNSKCPFCSSGVLSDWITPISWFNCGTMILPDKHNRFDQSKRCVIAEVAGLTDRIKRLEEFTNRFLDPEDLGYVVNNYVRDDAREALGRERVEAKP
jgi:hypothetical protein